MKQTDLFNQAIAAKLAGDEPAFQAAVSEAIKAKAKALISAAKPVTESGFYRDQNTGVEQVADHSYLIHGPIALPEGAVANQPAGQYSFVIDVESRADGDQPVPTVTLVQVYPFEDDTLLGELHGPEAEHFAQQFIGQDILASISGHSASGGVPPAQDDF